MDARAHMAREASDRNRSWNRAQGVTLHVLAADSIDSLTTLVFHRQETSFIEIGRISGADTARDELSTEDMVSKTSNTANFRCPVTSRKHARIVFTDAGNVCVTDLGSHHGTSRIQAHTHISQQLTPHTQTLLGNGDVLTFGKSVGRRERDNFVVRPVTVRVEFIYSSGQAAPSAAPTMSMSRIGSGFPTSPYDVDRFGRPYSPADTFLLGMESVLHAANDSPDVEHDGFEFSEDARRQPVTSVESLSYGEEEERLWLSSPTQSPTHTPTREVSPSYQARIPPTPALDSPDGAFSPLSSPGKGPTTPPPQLCTSPVARYHNVDSDDEHFEQHSALRNALESASGEFKGKNRWDVAASGIERAISISSSRSSASDEDDDGESPMELASPESSPPPELHPEAEASHQSENSPVPEGDVLEGAADEPSTPTEQALPQRTSSSSPLVGISSWLSALTGGKAASTDDAQNELASSVTDIKYNISKLEAHRRKYKARFNANVHHLSKSLNAFDVRTTSVEESVAAVNDITTAIGTKFSTIEFNHDEVSDHLKANDYRMEDNEARLDEFDDRLDAIPEIEARIDVTEERLDKVEDRLEDEEDRVDELSKRMQGIEDNFNERLVKSEETVARETSELTSRINNMHERFAQGSRVQALEDRLTQEVHDADVRKKARAEESEKIQERLEEMEQKDADAEEAVSDIRSEVEEIEERMGDMDDRFTEMEGRIVQLDALVGVAQGSVTALSEQVDDDIKLELQELKEHLKILQTDRDTERVMQDARTIPAEIMEKQIAEALAIVQDATQRAIMEMKVETTAILKRKLEESEQPRPAKRTRTSRAVAIVVRTATTVTVGAFAAWGMLAFV